MCTETLAEERNINFKKRSLRTKYLNLRNGKTSVVELRVYTNVGRC